MPEWIDKWSGGRFYKDRRGRAVYVIEKLVDGVRYAITLPRSVKSPEAELALFFKDPAGYRERNKKTGLMPDEIVALTLDEVETFEKYLRDEKHRSEPYVRGVSGYLADWATGLAGRDLRRVSVRDLYRLLDAWGTARNYRVAALRTFCSYLVRRQRLKLGENAAALLEIVKPPPARLLEKQGYEISEVEQFYAALEDQRMRDYYLLGAKYGMHGTEIDRIARNEVSVTLVGKESIAAVLRFIHKGRHDHRLSIDAQALAAVRRFVDTHKRAPSTKSASYWAKKTAKALGWETPLHHGQLRHSNETWAETVGWKAQLEPGGISRQEAADILGHRSTAMIRDHYNNVQVPKMLCLPLKLFHPLDPTPLQVSSSERAKAG